MAALPLLAVPPPISLKLVGIERTRASFSITSWRGMPEPVFQPRSTYLISGGTLLV